MDLSKIRVLVADDEPKLRALVANALRALGCSVAEAGDGDEAWLIAQQRHVDVVVLDVMMPGMSGWDVCRRLKTDRALREAPGGAPKVLMLTGIGEAVNEMTSPLFSADAWLDKPFSMREMTAKVLELAQARGGPPASLPPDVLPDTTRPSPWDLESSPPVAAVGPSLKKVTRAVPELASDRGPNARAPRRRQSARQAPAGQSARATKASAEAKVKAKPKASPKKRAASAKVKAKAKVKASPARTSQAARPKSKRAASPKRARAAQAKKKPPAAPKATRPARKARPGAKAKPARRAPPARRPSR